MLITGVVVVVVKDPEKKLKKWKTGRSVGIVFLIIGIAMIFLPSVFANINSSPVLIILRFICTPVGFVMFFLGLIIAASFSTKIGRVQAIAKATIKAGGQQHVSQTIATPLGLLPRTARLTVVASFQLGMYEYDTRFIFMPLERD